MVSVLYCGDDRRPAQSRLPASYLLGLGWGGWKDSPFSGLALRTGAISHRNRVERLRFAYFSFWRIHRVPRATPAMESDYGSRLVSLFRRRSAPPTLAKPRRPAASTTFCLHSREINCFPAPLGWRLIGVARSVAKAMSEAGIERFVPENTTMLGTCSTLVLSAFTFKSLR
jgi:hypothetical protein